MKRKMKTNILPFLALASLLFAACATDNIEPGKQKQGQEIDTTGLTAFSMEKPNEDPETRLVGEYTGSGVRFFWTRRDKLFVYNPDPQRNIEWRRDKHNNIYEMIKDLPGANDDGRFPRAKFWFEGEYTKPEYRVRFTGRNSSYADKVVFMDTGNYLGPDLTGYEDIQTGDFATGIAHRQADGNYTFSLDHKASYLTFRPYSTQKAFLQDGGWPLEQIEISADQSVCGQFDIKGDTIDLSSRPTGYNRSTTGTLSYKNGKRNTRIPSNLTSSSLDIVMNIPPGTYTNFTVKYFFQDRSFSQGTGYVTKVYPRVTFTAGKNKVVSQKLQSTEYPADTYYMWDAAVGQHYWKGYEWNGPNPHQPLYTSTDQTSDKYPKDNTDSRWYNEMAPYADPTGAAPAVAATRSCKDLPNINELCWYVQYGLACEDREIYVVMDRIYCGGIWLRKLSAIARSEGKTVEELKAKAPDGIDYTRSIKEPNLGSGYMTTEKPDDLKDYFCLPMMGVYELDEKGNGILGAMGETLFYWSSTPVPGKPDYAYALRAGSYNHRLEVVALPRKYGLSVMWPTDR